MIFDALIACWVLADAPSALARDALVRRNTTAAATEGPYTIVRFGGRIAR